MDKKRTRKSQQLRVLLNAEPFGFGPTAAIADFFPHLRDRFAKVGYVGTGHTLDLQRKLPYDAFHDVSGLSARQLQRRLKTLFADYDIMLTALDFGMAETAVKAKLPVCIYDPLTWYWPQIHPVVSRCRLYIAQDFYGVKERIAHEPENFGATHVVPPIIPSFMPWRGKREHVLLNLGGLTNPYWKPEDTLVYARLIVTAFCNSAFAANESVVIAANSFLSRELREFGVRNYTREQMQDVLLKAKCAFMTPGLGNIFDAARCCTPTIWLPPTNDSQGQQRNILSLRRRSDGVLDWSDFLPNAAVDYGADQQAVLQRIAQNVAAAAADKKSVSRLAQLITRRTTVLRGTVVGACTGLMIDFGWGGSAEVGDLVFQEAKKGG